MRIYTSQSLIHRGGQKWAQLHRECLGHPGSGGPPVSSAALSCLSVLSLWAKPGGWRSPGSASVSEDLAWRIGGCLWELGVCSRYLWLSQTQNCPSRRGQRVEEKRQWVTISLSWERLWSWSSALSLSLGRMTQEVYGQSELLHAPLQAGNCHRMGRT